MRSPKRRYSTEPGPVSPVMQACHDRGIHPQYDDNEGTQHGGLPTYPYHSAPKEYATRRQLKKIGLQPARQPIRAQILWKHHGPSRKSGTRQQERVAHLYLISEAKPKKPPTPGQLKAAEAMKRARRTCPSCKQEKDYRIPTSRGECNECFEPELYANSTPEAGSGDDWAESWAAEEWDPEELITVPDMEAV
jgi:hypothetical protein